MKKALYLYFVVGAALVGLQGCSNEDDLILPLPGDEVQQPFFLTGQSSGTDVFFSNIVPPETIFVDINHTTTTPLDVNNDLIQDYEIISFQNNQGNQEFRGVEIKQLADSTWVADDFDSEIRVFSANDTLWVNAESWTWVTSPDKDKMPLAILLRDGQIDEEWGKWNGEENKYVGLKLTVGGEDYLGWIELTVADYDNYIIFNFASKKLSPL
ncbi:MAG: hypothetical protein WBH56_09750 [Bacteroidota bacterium]